jgi:putative tricarboxylic transport membrane protein
MVLVLAACLMHGFYPGPLMIKNSPQLLYAASGGMMTSTVWLALLGWPMSIYMLKLMCLDRQLILISCVALTFVGIFAINSSVFDVFLAILFGMVGYWMRRYGYPVAASAIAMILGEGLETELRRGLLLCDKSWLTFVTRPYTAGILIIAIAFLAYGTWGTIRLARQASAARRKAVEGHLAAQSGSSMATRHSA